MQMSMKLHLDCDRLLKPLEEVAPQIETELTARCLSQNLLGKLSSPELAQVIAEQLVALIILSLREGDLQQFEQQMQWEIGVSLHHHNLFKRNTDLQLIAIFRQLLEEKLPLSLRPEIEVLVANLEDVCNNCWNQMEQRWKIEHQLN